MWRSVNEEELKRSRTVERKGSGIQFQAKMKKLATE
jgi:hypothetical protein